MLAKEAHKKTLASQHERLDRIYQDIYTAIELSASSGKFEATRSITKYVLNAAEASIKTIVRTLKKKGYSASYEASDLGIVVSVSWNKE